MENPVNGCCALPQSFLYPTYNKHSALCDLQSFGGCSETLQAVDKCYYCLFYLNDHEKAIIIAKAAFEKNSMCELLLAVIIEVLIDWVEYDKINGKRHVEKWTEVLLKSRQDNQILDLQILKEYLKELKPYPKFNRIQRNSKPLKKNNGIMRKKQMLSKSNSNTNNYAYGIKTTILIGSSNLDYKSNTLYKRHYNMSIDRIVVNSRYNFNNQTLLLQPSHTGIRLISRNDDTILTNNMELEFTPGNNSLASQVNMSCYIDLMSQNLKQCYRNVENSDPYIVRGILTAGDAMHDHKEDSGLDMYSDDYTNLSQELFACCNAPVTFVNHLGDRLEQWRQLYLLLKYRIFKVARLINMNVNVPFMAIEFFSMIFVNTRGGTDAHIKNFLAFIFTTPHDDIILHLDTFHHLEKSLTRVEIAMFYLLAANCLLLALYIHNTNVRFDILGLFYFLVFVDVISIDGDFDNDELLLEQMRGALPNVFGSVDRNIIFQQRINYKGAFITRGFRYHKDLLKRNFGFLIDQVKRNNFIIFKDTCSGTLL
ncbi:uncharacterized protein BdWA1_004215 [Babesia duncani]|uniref:Uncharacterized protein n=1 Tax=Babesia duncani TaxID=323732 RepID=A0AAD9UM01_9APIC|nr:hypothetical protein BdWA1_004215 [Babesia duncani]